MEKIKEIKELEPGRKLVRFNGIEHGHYEFLMIHPHNKNYVLLLDELDQNAYSFYIPTVLEGEFYVNYTREDVKKHTIELLESKLERYKTSLGDPTWEDAITETATENNTCK